MDERAKQLEYLPLPASSRLREDRGWFIFDSGQPLSAEEAERVLDDSAERAAEWMAATPPLAKSA